jgi:hypothetical protein
MSEFHYVLFSFSFSFSFPFFFFSVRWFLMQLINLVDVSDYVYPEETKLREVAKRTGATVTTRESPH